MKPQLTDSQLKVIEERGRKAKELLENELIQGFFIQMRGDLLLEFESTALEDSDARKNAWQKAQLLKQFESKFTTVMKQGDNAKVTLWERAKAKVRQVI